MYENRGKNMIKETAARARTGDFEDDGPIFSNFL
jgi:hypothetical protein